MSIVYPSWQDFPMDQWRWPSFSPQALAAGNRFGIRYEEADAIEAAFQRRRAERIEQRLEAIEKLLAA